MGIMFAPDMLALVLSGKKTQTRRKFKQGDETIEMNEEWGYETKTWSVHRNGRKHWELGNTYAVQPGRGKKGVGRVRILSIRLERFCDISQADAEAEGFTDPAGFHAKIRELYGDDFDMTAPCWALTFQLVEGKATP